jgi:subtilisin family serine protease
MKIKKQHYLILGIVVILLLVFITVYKHNGDMHPKNNSEKALTKKKELLPQESLKIKRLASNINDDWELTAIGQKGKTVYINHKKSVVIAVIDSGVNLKGGNILNGINPLQNNNNVEDISQHGTNIAKLILKVNPNAKILPIKVIDSNDLSNPQILAKAIQIAVNHKVDLINISLGMKNKNDQVDKEINRAFKNNIPVVSSAGNYGGELFYPAREEKVISVIARDINNIDVAFSNKGIKKKSVSAPGVHLRIDNNTYVTGTSFATALVTGTLSLGKEIDNSVSIDTLNSSLYRSCADGNQYSYGLISLPKFLENIRENKKN